MSDPNAPAEIVRGNLGDRAVTQEAVVSFLNKELIPLLKEIRARLNQTIERPQIPIFDSAPVTDADFDPFGTRPPQDGVVSISTVDGNLYQRRNGNSTHEIV